MGEAFVLKLLIAAISGLATVVGVLWRRDAKRHDKCEEDRATDRKELEAVRTKVDLIQAERVAEMKSAVEQRVAEAKSLLQDSFEVTERSTEKNVAVLQALEVVRRTLEAVVERLSTPPAPAP